MHLLKQLYPKVLWFLLFELSVAQGSEKLTGTDLAKSIPVHFSLSRAATRFSRYLYNHRLW